MRQLTHLLNGSWFDRNLSKQCASAFYHLQIYVGSVDTADTTDTTKALVHTFVTSRVDYCNSLLYGLRASHLNKVQHVLNAAARLQPWPELLGHLGNKPVKMTYFSPPPTPRCNVDVRHSSHFRLTQHCLGEGGTKEMVY